MTERLLEKLTVLDEYSEKVMAMRTLKCRVQNISVKKSLQIPLIFDFHTGFEKPCPKAIASKLKESCQREQAVVEGQKMDTKLTSGLNKWKPKLLTSGFLPRKRLFGKANVRPYSVPGNLKYHPLGKKGNLYQGFIQIPDTTGILLKDGVKVRKKVIAQKDATSLGRSRWFKNAPPTKRNIESETTHLIPLSIEDELNRPNAKIINLSQSKQAASSPILSSTNPIIFHDTGYVQMFLLTRNRHYMKNKEKPRTLLDKWQIDDNTISPGAENLLKEEPQRKMDFPSVRVDDDDFEVHRDKVRSSSGERLDTSWMPVSPSQKDSID
ncbi:uncharacterized protein C1orf141 homolog [Dromiciops gliroides]|uniref:uncharacterized protein C1orf141 homolog n=1 Tax=Dromiciops gliroides TaxID=33562 RepID=UPI001CC3F671|nr:uncharacterized protein C1orf141 homolog [Dromiciops gliroides]